LLFETPKRKPEFHGLRGHRLQQGVCASKKKAKEDSGNGSSLKKDPCPGGRLLGNDGPVAASKTEGSNIKEEGLLLKEGPTRPNSKRKKKAGKEIWTSVATG